MNKPQTQYTKSGHINIAYQVFGSGDQDLVYIPGWVSNIDFMWDCPQLASFLLELGKVVRVILFDKRGTGLSDRLSDLSPLEERMDDLRAVLDAVDSEKAILFGHSEGGSVSALFSATYPDRTKALITFGVFAKRQWAEHYPWAPTTEERQKVYDMIASSWGSVQMDYASLAPSMKEDHEFMDWLARYFRSGASPSAALALTKMNSQIDIIDILDSIAVPTLLLQRTDDIDVKIEEGKFIADRIENSKFVEFPGDDHLFWAGDTGAVLTEMMAFIHNLPGQVELDKYLATILKIRVHDDQNSNKTNTSFVSNLKNLINQYRGELINSDKDIMTATFSGPSKAVNCADAILNTSALFELQVAQCLHIGEVSAKDQKLISGLTISVVDKILEIAKPGQILITNTINNLLSGTGLYFESFGVLNLYNQKKLEILLLKSSSSVDIDEPDQRSHISFQKTGSKNYSLLEDVLQIIDAHIQDENFTIENLSAALGMSLRQFQRRIKLITNKSPNTLIRSVRLHKAKELIIQEERSVKEAAYMTGFNSVPYFSTCFKKEFGQVPSSF